MNNQCLPLQVVKLNMKKISQNNSKQQQEVIQIITQYLTEEEMQKYEKQQQIVIQSFNIAYQRLKYCQEAFDQKQKLRNLKYFYLQYEEKNRNQIIEKMKARLKLPIEKVLKNHPNPQDCYYKASSWLLDMQNTESITQFLYEFHAINSIIEKYQGGEYKENILLLNQNFDDQCNNLLHISTLYNYIQEEDQNINILHLNLSGKNDQSLIDFNALFTKQKQKHFKYITLIPYTYTTQVEQQEQKQNEFNQLKTEDNNNSQQKNFIKYFPKQNINKKINSQLILPVVMKENCTQLNQKQFQSIFTNLIRKEITDFQPQVIFVDLSISNKFQISLPAIEECLRHLTKQYLVCVSVSVDKDIHIEQEVLVQQNQVNGCKNLIYNIFSTLNCIVQGLLLRKFVQYQLNDNLTIEIGEWAMAMSKLYSFNKQIAKNFENFNKQCLAIQQNYKLEDLYYITINQNENQIIRILPKYQNNIIEHQFYTISKKHQIIVLISKCNQFYFLKWDNQQGIQITSKDQLQSKLQIILNRIPFNQIPIKEKLIEPSICIFQDIIIFVYGRLFDQNKKQEQFNNLIYVYYLSNNSIIKVKRTLPPNQVLQYITNQNAEDIIKDRRAPQVCYDISLKTNEQLIQFALIGGEVENSIKIMNVIELIYLDLQNKTFHSCLLNTQKLSKTSSIKPYPYQLILSYQDNNESIILTLCGNNQLRKNCYSFPINMSYYQTATLIQLNKREKDKKKQQSLKHINIIQNDDYFKYYEIENEEIQIDFINKINNQYEWKTCCTRLTQIHNPQFCNNLLINQWKQEYDYSPILKIEFEHTFKLDLDNEELIVDCNIQQIVNVNQDKKK